MVVAEDDGVGGAAVVVNGHGVDEAGGQRVVRDDDLVQVVVVAVLQAGRGRAFEEHLLLALLRLLHLPAPEPHPLLRRHAPPAYGLLRPGRQGRYHGDGLAEGDALAALAQRALGPADQDLGVAVVARQRLVALVNVRAVHLSVGGARVAQGEVTAVAGVRQQRIPGGRRRRVRKRARARSPGA